MISVIVPAYNAEDTIKKCLEALLNQSIAIGNYEIIIVDDGSTDKTADIIKKFSMVRYIYQENQGPAKARNEGAKEAKGEIILFTDSDCEADACWIEEMVKPFDDPEIIGVKGSYKTKQKRLIAKFAQIEFEERYELQKKCRYIDLVDSYSAGFRKDIFWKVGGFDTSFPVANNEDTELSYKLATQGYKMVFNPKAFVYHMKHPDTLYKYLKLKFWRAYWRIVVYKKFPHKMIKDSYTPQTLKLQILLVYLGLFSFVGSFFSFIFRYILFGGFILFILTTISFTIHAFKKDRLVGLLSPVFLFLRSFVFAFGVIKGVLHQ